ncbi:MAG: hypothetical protein VB108_09860 [Anaerolineaceae bacterium]|nr:hypothetical protein [Anaerolineaceae bacterium]
MRKTRLIVNLILSTLLLMLMAIPSHLAQATVQPPYNLFSKVRINEADETKELYQHVLDVQKQQKPGNWVHLIILQRKTPIQQSYWNEVLMPEKSRRELWINLNAEKRVKRQVFTIADSQGKLLVSQKFNDGLFTDVLKDTEQTMPNTDFAFDMNFGVQSEITELFGRQSVKITVVDALPELASLDGKEMFYNLFRSEDYYDFNTGLLLKGVDTIFLTNGQEI